MHSRLHIGSLFSNHEGSSFREKYIEILQPYSSTVGVSDYQLRLYTNGAASPSQTMTLSGMLASGAVIVIRNGSAGIYSGVVNSTVINHNGDDALTCQNFHQRNCRYIGRIGNDPGAGLALDYLRLMMLPQKVHSELGHSNKILPGQARRPSLWKQSGTLCL